MSAPVVDCLKGIATSQFRSGHPPLPEKAGPEIRAYRSGDLIVNAGVRLYQDRSRESDTGVHHVQTLEGREAHIGTGTSLPLGERTIYARSGGARVHDAIRYRDLTSGFYVVPSLNGNIVTLDISSRSMRTTSAS